MTVMPSVVTVDLNEANGMCRLLVPGRFNDGRENREHGESP